MIKKYINKIIEQYIKDNAKYILEILDKYIEKDDIIDEETKTEQISFQCEYYEKVDKNKRYFAQRIENGKINNKAPKYAKYVVSVMLKQPDNKQFVIDYSDVEKPIPEEARIHEDVSGPSFNFIGKDLTVAHYKNYKRFFSYDVGRDIAIKSILDRVKMKNRG
jgi:hypothetical protein